MQTMEIPAYLFIADSVKEIKVPRSTLYDGSLAEYASKFNAKKICFAYIDRSPQRSYYDCYECTADGNIWRGLDQQSASSLKAPLAELLKEKVFKEDILMRLYLSSLNKDKGKK